MFERYSERARKALFYARYEVSQLGGQSIESEHLLLGLMRDRQGLISEIFDRAHVPIERVREEMARRCADRPKVTASVEIPFGDDVKRSLMLAAEQADLLGDPEIGREHLLLGLLRQDTCVAALVLAGYGLQLDAVRHQIVSIRLES
jgi:ATP-dependent Clp protease ATP-binding subunit ClpC